MAKLRPQENYKDWDYTCPRCGDMLMKYDGKGSISDEHGDYDVVIFYCLEREPICCQLQIPVLRRKVAR